MSLRKSRRQEEIRRFLYERGQATVAELGERLGASEATIRRDLDELAVDGVLQRMHGGAMRASPAAPEPPIFQREHEEAQSKAHIGRAAAELIADRETVFLGSGSTVLAVAHHLKQHRELTVISNSLPVINLLANVPGISVVVLGGLLRQSEMSMLGHITEQAIAELRADKVIMGIRAVHLNQGLTNDYLPETMTDRTIVKLSPKIVLVADHTKFGQISTAYVAPVTVVHTVVTDSQIATEVVEGLTAAGIRVIVAGETESIVVHPTG